MRVRGEHAHFKLEPRQLAGLAVTDSTTLQCSVCSSQSSLKVISHSPQQVKKSGKCVQLFKKTTALVCNDAMYVDQCIFKCQKNVLPLPGKVFRYEKARKQASSSSLLY